MGLKGKPFAAMFASLMALHVTPASAACIQASSGLRHVIRRTLGRAIRVSGVGALALLAAPDAIAQEPPSFRAGTTLVEVSAIVTRAGVPVTDLSAEEVTVFDEGRVQPLVAFEFVNLTTGEGLAERRDFVLVSEGPRVLPHGPGDHETVALRSAYQALLRETASANVAIYAIDPRGIGGGSGNIRRATNPYRLDARGQPTVGADSTRELPPSTAEYLAAAMASRHSGTLGQLSRFTGGILTVDSNGLGKNIPRVIQDSRQYYRVVYVQPELDHGGRHPTVRRIHVHVTRPGVEVRARQQYVPR